MKILITGSSGYVGNFLVEHFTSLGQDVVGCDVHMMERQKVLSHFIFRLLDVTDSEACHRIVQEEKPDRVIHLAYLMNPQHDAEFERSVDVDGSMNVFIAANACESVKQFLQYSSTSTYGANTFNELWIEETTPLRPNDYVYGKHKKTVEEACAEMPKREDMKLVIVRMCTAVGPTYYKPGSVISTFTKAPVALAVDGVDMKVQWIYEDDVKALLYLILKDMEIEGTYNLVPDSFTSIAEMAHTQKKPIIYVPGFLLRAIFWVLWTLRLSNTSPPMARLMTYGIVASPKKLQERYSYVFSKTSLQAFVDTVDLRRKNGTL